MNERDNRTLSSVFVLVVEDDPDMQELLRTIFEIAGAKVVTAGTVPEALEILKRTTPHVLLIDIGLPGYNGYALIGRVRALDDPVKRNLPAIALTAFASTTDRDIALTSGFQMFLSKPFDADNLVDAIAQVIGLRRNAA